MEFTLAMSFGSNNFGESAKQYIDISPVISSRIAVFPGDEEFSRKVAMSFAGGNHLELSAIRTTVHVGAHADAPSHYVNKGAAIDQRDLNFYFGLCQVVRVKVARGERVMPVHLSHEKIRAQRVLIHTGSFPNPEEWVSDFNSLSPELVHFLADQGVRTVGIDTPSVDPADSKGLESHHALAERDMAVLEGIVLSEVPVGLYTLIALPLRLQGVEASPVRAILLPNIHAM
jgi:arylformamidase